jgi:hypothetical protein
MAAHGLLLAIWSSILLMARLLSFVFPLEHGLLLMWLLENNKAGLRPSRLVFTSSTIC